MRRQKPSLKSGGHFNEVVTRRSNSFDCNEPEHVHVQRENKVCKYWLTPLALGRNDGFSVRELNQIRTRIALNMETILEAWHEHCG